MVGRGREYSGEREGEGRRKREERDVEGEGSSKPVQVGPGNNVP